jgi:hypothetical protein
MNSQLIASFFESKDVLELKEKIRQHDKKVNQFDVLSIFKEQIGETVWSKFFAFLLDSNERHGLKLDFFFEWIKQIKIESTEFEYFLTDFNLAEVTRVKSYTEWKTPEGRFIDIVLELFDLKGTIVGAIGIENKVNAGEQPNQVADYQQSLTSNFGGVKRCLLFLTPNERPSQTKLDKKDCPTFEVGYKSISNCLSSIRTDDNPHQELYINILNSYLEKLMGKHENNQEIKDAILKLYRIEENRNVMKWIAKCMPGTHLLTGRLRSGVTKVAEEYYSEHGGNLFYTYPESLGANPQEFKSNVIEFEYKGVKLNLIFMLRCDNSNPGIGDEFEFRIAFYIYDGFKKLNDEVKTEIRKGFEILPNTSKNWDKWINLHTGDTWILEDYGEKDIVGLNSIFEHGVKKNYDSIIKLIKSN